MIDAINGYYPDVDSNVFIAPGAQIIGNVKLMDGVSVWHNAVIRGDITQIVVGRGSNIQDNCTLHCDKDIPVIIGNNVTVGHNAVLHSCEVGDGSLVGMGAIVLGGAKIGKGCLVAAGAVVTPGTVVPDGSLYMGSPAKLKRQLSDKEQEGLLNNALEYTRLSAEFKAQRKIKVAKNCVLLKGLSESQYDMVQNLYQICRNYEPLKLCLNWSSLEHSGFINNVLSYESGALAGYLGIYNSKPGEIEVTGMVNPELRRQGIFSAMLSLAEYECKKRGARKITLIADRNVDCAKFAMHENLLLDHSEILMKCEKNGWKLNGGAFLTFRKATNNDLKELAFLEMLCFGIPLDQAMENYACGLCGNVYIAQENGKPIGKVGITDEKENGRIYGLAVVPGSRGRGYGHEILEFALEKIFSTKNSAITEINEKNKSAIAISNSCGFKEETFLDYYVKNKVKQRNN